MSTSRVKQPKSKFTKHQVETAVLVLMESKSITNWVRGQARFFGIDPNTEEGKKFCDKQAREAAERMIQ